MPIGITPVAPCRETLAPTHLAAMVNEARKRLQELKA
jgi:hypothetical protein